MCHILISNMSICIRLLCLLSHCSVFFFFFFSSRRRHTRYIGDWSSDVCSSDLEALCKQTRHDRSLTDRTSAGARASLRSEERRVGKECRSRWSPDRYKKKKEEKENASNSKNKKI